LKKNETYTETYTVKEVAERLRLSTKTVYKMVEENKIPCIRTSNKGKILFKKDLIQEMFKEEM
jgi:excisionase family DNA binding protein